MIVKFAQKWAWTLLVCIACIFDTVLAEAKTQEISPAELFQSLCVANEARIDVVEANARRMGFTSAPNPAPTPEGFTRLVSLARDTSSGKQALVVGIGATEVIKALPNKVPARTCAVTAAASDWDPRSLAASLAGVKPLFDGEGVVVYSYALLPTGNVIADDYADRTSFIAALNAGRVRTLAVKEQGPIRALSWVVFETPDKPVVAPVSQPTQATTTRDTDPFAPCVWKQNGKGSAAVRKLSCPTDQTTRGLRGLTEDSPARANSGDVSSMLRLAKFYVAGPTDVRDPAAGFGWSRRAADAGSAEGAFNLALLFEAGTGVAQDKSQAVSFYTKAAESGYLPAMINLAAMQVEGEGTQKDQVAAARLMQKAADARSIDGQFNMGTLFETGIGIAKDQLEAIRWYRLAADQKDSRSMYRLGIIYADGIGVPQSASEAKRWLLDSFLPVQKLINLMIDMELLIASDRGRSAYLAKANEGDGNAAFRLGMLLSNEKNKEYDPTTALRLLKIAADKGFPAAMSSIGVLYANGQGVAQDDAEAIRWLRAGGLKQNPEGLRRIRTLFEVP